MKSFKQYIKEEYEKVELVPGVVIDPLFNEISTNRDGYEWLKDNLGLLFKVGEQPRNKSHEDAQTYNYFNIKVGEVIDRLFKTQSLFVDGDKTIQVSFYRFIEPETRKYVQKICDVIGSSKKVEMDDSYILKYVKPKELYLYPR